jgi:hypothetical protein
MAGRRAGRRAARKTGGPALIFLARVAPIVD